ncbi:uncharacterized protein BDR25DRAFT_308104 [Lindgomyces ingoldianus]|uniref:Uncharacterized protein n=1 Tax=Lindgomyces ingoldianus TaxID=673940 RepID=A0ACB6Q7P6_9PLEO|nr:uncharacterized protein BDR25DRAFT_308104 [Lindgomyces ingoldianus]KAF2462872.1 hypothetical protein BDR25DRAFT_308104 [Lindgomyces ingoldianus]
MEGKNQSIELLRQPPHSPSPPYLATWGNDVVQDPEERNGYNGRIAHAIAYDCLKIQTKAASHTTWMFLQDPVWPFLKSRMMKKQAFALLLLFLGGIIPFIVLGKSTSYDRYHGTVGVYGGIFTSKLISCGDAFGDPQNATVSGIEALFVLDYTFGSFLFSQAKTIDVAWDVCVGRGAQFIAWYVAYVVFSDALLRVIERHPASYHTFTRICLEGPSLTLMWVLLKNIFQAQSKRTWTLFFYMLLSTGWILSMPTWLSAMTGYDSTTISWVDLDNSNNIAPASSFEYQNIVYGTWNHTFDKSACSSDKQLAYYTSYSYTADQNTFCSCQLPNGTLTTISAWTREWHNSRSRNGTRLYDCIFTFPGNNQTYKDFSGNSHNCNGTAKITLFNQTYDVQDLNSTFGYCYNGKGYSSSEILSKSRCLPDTANPSYKWGFSTMLSGLFVIIQFVWSLTMYAVWQDAQFGSKLIKAGFQMTELIAAFTLTLVARQKTGLSSKELLLAETKKLKRELYGGKNDIEAKIEYNIFMENSKQYPECESEDEEEVVLRRRNVRSEEFA